MFLWSEKQGKYVYEPFFNNLEHPTLFEEARCIVSNRYVNDERIEYEMYQYDGHYRHVSSLVQRGYTSDNLLFVLYDAAGNPVREVKKPTFEQLTPLWQKFAVLYHLGY